MLGDVLDLTRIAVVVPLYGQAHYVTEAVSSVLAQTEPHVTTVIVNDGCPDPASHHVGHSLSVAYPDRVAYLRRPNGGLSAARNTGIRFALARFPSLEAVFLLDADNALQPGALAILKARLDAEPEVSWVAPHMRLFGEINRPWRLPAEFSPFRALFENQADAAALFRACVFEQTAYDESMRLGYEDWELFLRLALSGHRGVSDHRAVAWYRSRANSMLANAKLRDLEIRRYMRNKHSAAHRPRGRTAIEHSDLPRFALIDESGAVTALTDPAAAPARAAVDTSPPFLVLVPAAVRERLHGLGLLRGLLYTATPGNRDDAVVVTLSDDEYAVEHRWPRSGGDAIGVVVSADLVRRAQDGPEYLVERLAAAREVSVGHPQFQVGQRWSDAELAERLIAAGAGAAVDHPRVRSALNEGAESAQSFVSWMHQEAKRGTYPLIDDGRVHVGFIVPWMLLGGVEHCVLQITRAIRAARTDVDVHLALTEGGRLELDAVSAGFASVTSFAGLPHERKVVLAERWAASMDLVVNAHSEVGFTALRHRAATDPGDRQSIELAYLHVIDRTVDGLSSGWPLRAAQLDPFIDRHLVISDDIAAAMRSAGVPGRKFVHVPNAPVVRPLDRQAALDLAESKATRVVAREPLRVLISGRLDYQKGGARAAVAIRRLTEWGHDVLVWVMGVPTLDADVPELPDERCTWLGRVTDPDQLAHYFAETDVLLLLSRWEGVPLAMLDAMAHGSVVIATDVGGVTEVAHDTVNARVVPVSVGQTDGDIGESAALIMAELIGDPTGNVELRKAAVDTAWSLSWDTAANRLLGLLAMGEGTR